jgi:protein-S-isoprenylcysteine O-methyltransferase Ste14
LTPTAIDHVPVPDASSATAIAICMLCLAAVEVRPVVMSGPRGGLESLRHRGVLASLSISTLSAALVVTAGTLARIVAEARLLMERFPGYPEYAARTSRMIPRVF